MRALVYFLSVSVAFLAGCYFGLYKAEEKLMLFTAESQINQASVQMHLLDMYMSLIESGEIDDLKDALKFAKESQLQLIEIPVLEYQKPGRNKDHAIYIRNIAKSTVEKHNKSIQPTANAAAD